MNRKTSLRPMCEPLAVAAVERCSSIAYLHALFDCHARGRILVAAAADVQPPAGTRIVERIACATGGGWFSERITPIDSAGPAQIALTSGTTGDSKAILLSHRALADVE